MNHGTLYDVLFACNHCDYKDDCCLARFMGKYPLSEVWKRAQSLKAHRLFEHLRGTYNLALELANRIFSSGFMMRNEACLACYSAGIHDIGHILETFDDVAKMVEQIESRHTHKLEMWLRLQGQPTIANAIRHSSPLVIADAMSQRLTLAQLIVVAADFQTDASGKTVPLRERLATINNRHQNNPGWDAFAHEKAFRLVESFLEWGNEPKSRFCNLPDTPAKTQVFFVERCDGKYASPATAVYCDSNSVYQICRTAIAASWHIYTVDSCEAPDTEIQNFHPVHGSRSATETAKIICRKAEVNAFIVSSWLSLLTNPALAKYNKILLIRGIRAQRLSTTYMSRVRDAVLSGDIRCVVVSSTLKALFQDYAVPAITIENGIDNHFLPSNIAPKKRKILFVGAPINAKGFPFVCRLASLLAPLNICVEVAGEPAIYGEENMECPVPPNVKYLGYVPYCKLPELYEESLATVIPTDPRIIMEGFSKVALESLSMGTPILVSNCGHLPQWITSDKVGCCATIEDCEKIFYNYIKTNLQDLLNGNFSAICRSRVVGYSWEKSAWQMDRLFDDVLLENNCHSLSREGSAYDRFSHFIDVKYPSLSRTLQPIELKKRIPHGGKVLAIEPHPDDIVFGSVLALLQFWEAGYDIQIVSFFSQSSLSSFRFASSFFSSVAELKTIREEENIFALCKLLPFSLLQIGLPTAKGRGYTHAFMQPSQNDTCRRVIHDTLDAMLKDADMLICPAGFGGHADHLVIVDELINSHPNTLLYEEGSYFADSSSHYNWLLEKGFVPSIHIQATKDNLLTKERLVSCYMSQVPVSTQEELRSYVNSMIHPGSNTIEVLWCRNDQ